MKTIDPDTKKPGIAAPEFNLAELVLDKDGETGAIAAYIGIIQDLAGQEMGELSNREQTT